ncbi:Uncharacterised protein [Sphingobacterium daejeonense]|nr:Uncharacterised protein [Sphingobacterium daejeonense]
MATVGAEVYEHPKKADGTYNVKIRVYHKEEKKLSTLLISFPKNNSPR